MPIQRIHARDGSVLHEGVARNKREFVKELVARGASFAGARMQRVDLSHLDLTSVDFTGADLTDANFRGAVLDRACFEVACLSGACMAGARARFANLKFALVGPSERQAATFAGAVLTYSCFMGARVSDTTFEGAGLSSCDFRSTVLKRCRFALSWLGNADFGAAYVQGCVFDEAHFVNDNVARIPVEASPDLTVGTIAVGNSFKGARLPETLGAFRKDKVVGYAERTVAVASSAIALLAVTDFATTEIARTALADLSVDGVFKGVAGTGVMFLAATTLAGMVSDKIADGFKGLFEGGLGHVQRFVRRCIGEVASRGAKLSDYAFAMVKGPSRSLVREIVSLGVDGRDMEIGSSTFLFVSNRNAAKALETIGRSFRNLDRTEDLLVFIPDATAGQPTAMRFFRSGGHTAFWCADGAVVGWKTFGRSGTELVMHGTVPDVDAAGSRRAFERGILDVMGAPVDFAYDPRSHSLRAGGDGSLVVVVTSKSSPSNVDGGYILVRPDGSAYDQKGARALSMGPTP